MKKLIILAILALSINAFAQIPTNGLVGYWPFNGNANDVSGNGHNGVVHGATLTKDRFGNYNSAYSFNGYNNYIAIPDNSNLNLTGDLAISCWFSANSPLPTNLNSYSLVAKRFCNFGTIPSLYTPYDLTINYALPNDYDKIMFVSSNGPSAGFVYSQMSVQVDTNVWNHIVVSIHKDSIDFYLNGIYYQTILNGTTHRGGNTDSLLFGGIARAFGDEYLRGYLDDIRIYNRALNANEVGKLYQEHKCYETIIDQIPTNGLIAWYPFNGNTLDMTGKGHNGFNHGATLTTDRFSNRNSAYSFNGYNDYIAVPNKNDLNITGDLSISCWFSANSPLPQNNNDFTLIAKRFCGFGTITSQYTPYDLAINYNKPNDYSKIMFVSANGPSAGFVYSQMTTPVDSNIWNHIVVAIHNDSINYYLNGIYYQTILNGTTHRGGNSDSLIIGGIARAFGDEYMRGYIDDIRIYNRALNINEVGVLYREHVYMQTVYDTITTKIFDTTYFSVYDTIMDDTLVIKIDTFNGISLFNNQNAIKIYPNPAHNHITIDFGINYIIMKNYTCEIIDVNAKKTVYSLTKIINQIENIDITKWTKGLYFIKLFDSKGKPVFTGKILKT